MAVAACTVWVEEEAIKKEVIIDLWVGKCPKIHFHLPVCQ